MSITPTPAKKGIPPTSSRIRPIRDSFAADAPSDDLGARPSNRKGNRFKDTVHRGVILLVDETLRRVAAAPAKTRSGGLLRPFHGSPFSPRHAAPAVATRQSATAMYIRTAQ